MKKVYIIMAHPKMDDSYVFGVYSNNKEAEDLAKLLEKESLDRYYNDQWCHTWTEYEVKEYIVEG